MSNSDPGGPQRGQPSLVPGLALLVVAAALIVLVLINPPMPGWLRTVIAIVAVCVVLALLAYTAIVFRGATRRGGGR